MTLPKGFWLPELPGLGELVKVLLPASDIASLTATASRRLLWSTVTSPKTRISKAMCFGFMAAALPILLCSQDESKVDFDRAIGTLKAFRLITGERNGGPSKYIDLCSSTYNGD